MDLKMKPFWGFASCLLVWETYVRCSIHHRFFSEFEKWVHLSLDGYRIARWFNGARSGAVFGIPRTV
jgi:hypothetical protein